MLNSKRPLSSGLAAVADMIEHTLITPKDIGLYPSMDYSTLEEIISTKFKELKTKYHRITLVLKPEDLRMGADPRTARPQDVKYSISLIWYSDRVSIVYQDSNDDNVYHQRDIKNTFMSNPELYAMTATGLRELRDPAKRDHPSLRWGQAVVNKFMKGVHTELFHAGDERTHEIVEQMIKDYQLEVTPQNSISHHTESN